MQISRRDFGRSIAGALALTLLGGGSLSLAGCSLNPRALINTVIGAIGAIIKVADPTATWLQPLQAALAQLQQAVLQWTGGSAAQIIINALNAVQAVLAVIPLTAVYSPLIAVLVAGIEAVLNYFVPAPAPMAANNPYLGARRATLKPRSFMHPTYQGAFRAQWNEVADGVGLPQCKI